MGLTFLKNIPFFRHLPKKELKRVLGLARIADFQEGDMIFSQKASGNHLFIVLNGRVKIYVTSPNQKRKTLAILEKGDFFGEMALLDGHVRSASARVLGSARLLLIHKKDFKNLLFSDPAFGFKILRTLSERLRRANEEIGSLLFQNLFGRVVRALVEISKRGKKTEKGLLMPKGLTHKELADYVGSSRVPITRALGVLRRMGVIEYHGRDLLIQDADRLKSWV